MDWEEDEEDVDALFDIELEAASQGAEDDEQGLADEEALGKGGITGEREKGNNDVTLKSVWEKSNKQARVSSSGQQQTGIATVKKPRPKLTERELSGERGLEALRDSFLDFEVRNELGPYANINRILDRIETWAHCLYPPLGFDDFLEKVEVLGKKRLTRFALNNIRLGVASAAKEATNAKDREEDSDQGSAKWPPNYVDDFYTVDFDNRLPRETREGQTNSTTVAQSNSTTAYHSSITGKRMDENGDTSDEVFIHSSAKKKARLQPLSSVGWKRAVMSDDEEGDERESGDKTSQSADGKGGQPTEPQINQLSLSAAIDWEEDEGESQEPIDESELIAGLMPDDDDEENES